MHQRLKELKEKSNLTNQQIADLSGVPVATVNRILSGQTDNPSFITISSMVKAMGGSLDEFTKTDEERKAEADKSGTSDEKERLIKLYREIIATKNKYIRYLFFLTIGLMSIIVIVLILDILNPNIGFFRKS